MRIWSRLVAALLLLVLVGCTTTKQEQSTKLPDKKVELVIMTSWGFEREALDDVIDLYEGKHPNVKVRVKENRGGLTNSDGSINQAAVEGVDIFLPSSGYANYLHSKGLGRDLSTVRLPSLDPAVAALADEMSRLDGTRIGIPLVVYPVGMTLNTPIFTKANVALPPVDWTIQEFEQTLMQFKSAGITKSFSFAEALQPVFGAFGGEMVDTATGEIVIDRPEAVQALTWLGEAVRNELLRYDPSPDQFVSVIGGPDGPPISGFFFGGSTLPPGLMLQPTPRGPAGRSTQIEGSVGMVLQSSPNPETAIDFLREMLANPEAQRAMARTGMRPLLNDSQALALWREKVGDRHADSVELGLASGTTQPAGFYRLNEQVQPFLEGTATLEQLLPTLKQNLRP